MKDASPPAAGIARGRCYASATPFCFVSSAVAPGRKFELNKLVLFSDGSIPSTTLQGIVCCKDVT